MNAADVIKNARAGLDDCLLSPWGERSIADLIALAEEQAAQIKHWKLITKEQIEQIATFSGVSSVEMWRAAEMFNSVMAAENKEQAAAIDRVRALAEQWERETRNRPASEGPVDAWLHECAHELHTALDGDQP